MDKFFLVYKGASKCLKSKEMIFKATTRGEITQVVVAMWRQIKSKMLTLVCQMRKSKKCVRRILAPNGWFHRKAVDLKLASFQG